MKTLWRFILRLAVSLLISFVLLEAGLAWLSSTGRLKLPRPSYCLTNVWSRFWVDRNPFFGVWHEPHSTYTHVSPEWRLTYHANAWGMRDRERSKERPGPPSLARRRVVVLGDSFVEGWGVASEDRLSDRLEQATGLEHLNFGTSGSFGPTQYLMLYTHLAREFEHDAVILVLLPDNDFLDDDYDYGRIMHQGRYRPFFVGKKPDYRLVYSPAQTPSLPSRLLEQGLLQLTYTGNLIKQFKSVARHERSAVPADYAGYFDFSPAQWDRLEHVLREFRRAAPALPILVLTVPCDTDFRRAEKAGAPPLPGKLAALCHSLNMQYLDLFESLRDAPGGWPTCYLKTDRHWNATGNRVAADAVLAQAEFYRQWDLAPQRRK